MTDNNCKTEVELDEYSSRNPSLYMRFTDKLYSLKKDCETKGCNCENILRLVEYRTQTYKTIFDCIDEARHQRTHFDTMNKTNFSLVVRNNFRFEKLMQSLDQLKQVPYRWLEVLQMQQLHSPTNGWPTVEIVCVCVTICMTTANVWVGIIILVGSKRLHCNLQFRTTTFLWLNTCFLLLQ